MCRLYVCAALFDFPRGEFICTAYWSETNCYFILNANSFHCSGLGFPCSALIGAHIAAPFWCCDTHTQTRGRACRPVGVERSRRWLSLPLTSLFRLYMQTDRQVSDQLDTNYPLLVRVADSLCADTSAGSRAVWTSCGASERRGDEDRLWRGRESVCVFVSGALLLGRQDLQPG